MPPCVFAYLYPTNGTGWQKATYLPVSQENIGLVCSPSPNYFPGAPMSRYSTFARATATVALTLGIITTGHTPGFEPQAAKAALSIAAPTSAERVVAGDGFICARVTSSNATRIMCSGKNTSGQLGDGTTTNREYLSEISDWRKVDGTRQIAAGKSHVCAISGVGSTSPPGEGTLYCWGDNQYGQLGIGNTTNSSVPVAVVSNAGFTNGMVKGLVLGDNHTCAIQNVNSFDKLYCWGLNNKGQLGDTTTQNRSLPTAVQGVFATGIPYFSGSLSHKQPMAAGSEHTCAAQILPASTFLYCWGENGSGQLGNGTTADSATPVSTGLEVLRAGGTYTTFVTAGHDFTCSTDSGVVKCWGDNSSGQMGNGTNPTDVLVPTAIPNNGAFVNSGANTIVAGGQTACFVTSALIVWCWGANDAGQVGDNTQATQNRPTRVADNAGAGFTNGLLGGFNNNHAGIAIGNSVTDGFVCLTGWCWGGNASGQLALNTTARTALPTRMLVGTRTPDDVTGASVTAVYTSAGVVVTFTGVPATGMSNVSVTVAPTSNRLLPSQIGGIGVPNYAARNFSGGTLPTVSGNSFSVTVPNMTIQTFPMVGPPITTTAEFASTGSYHLTYSVTGSAAAGYPDGWRLRNTVAGSQVVIVTGTTPDTPAAANAVAPVTPVAPASTTAAVPGVTVTDTKVYTAAVPRKVAAGSAIAVMTPAQAKTRDVETLTPMVCVPANDDLVFIKTGRCVAQVVNEKTGRVLRTLSTRVVAEEVSELSVGNEIVTLAPIYFAGASASVDATAIKRLQSIKDRISAAGTVLLVGHSGILMGNTPENQELSRTRAIATRRELQRMGAKGPFFITSAGALAPATTRMTSAAQAKNRRVVIVLIP
jgi:alpha-tubulin suppressor-like RCC1 family protein/outer membrane protein OmpA-like peptidoglycan-associated protein